MDPRTFNPGVELSPVNQVDQVGATEACRELELITGNVDAEKQCKWSCCYFLDFV